MWTFLSLERISTNLREVGEGNPKRVGSNQVRGYTKEEIQWGQKEGDVRQLKTRAEKLTLQKLKHSTEEEPSTVE